MKKNFLTGLGSAVVAALCCRPAAAWWDEGHMIVAAIARELLTNKQLEGIERPLKHWAWDFDENSRNLVAAAVWPDHLKCASATEAICEGFDRANALSVFDPWHYMMLPFNPQNLTLEAPFSDLPWPGVGATFAMKQLVRGPWHLHHDWQNEPLGRDGLALRLSRHDASYAGDEQPSNSGQMHPLSAFSWNLRLRFLVHILGDVHQPLHVVETFTRKLPHGDRGGNLWTVRTTAGRIMKLHAYWDSCAEQFEQDWPQMRNRDVAATAKGLLKDFPPESFEPHRRNLTSFTAIANDSYAVAIKDVFSFVNLQDPAAGEGPVYQLSYDYEQMAKKLCRQQIVLGGFRLAQLLVQLYDSVLADWQPEKIGERARGETERGGRLAAAYDGDSYDAVPYDNGVSYGGVSYGGASYGGASYDGGSAGLADLAAAVAAGTPSLAPLQQQQQPEVFKAPSLHPHHHLRLGSVIFGIVLGSLASFAFVHWQDHRRQQRQVVATDLTGPLMGDGAEDTLAAASGGGGGGSASARLMSPA